jgi:phosphoglycerate dehydrogenase-like enzyme
MSLLSNTIRRSFASMVQLSQSQAIAQSSQSKATSMSTLVRHAKIVCLTGDSSPLNDYYDIGNNNEPQQYQLPAGATIVQTGGAIQDFDVEALRASGANVVLVRKSQTQPTVKEPLATLLKEVPSLTWVHTLTTGFDYIASPILAEHDWGRGSDTDTDTETTNTNTGGGVLTNARGISNSVLAEYAIMSCLYFAKELPRLRQQQVNKEWKKYPVQELRGATLGIFGYGSIGQTCAERAKAFGMKVIATRRTVPAEPDAYCDAVYGNDDESLLRLFAESDYLICAAPLTAETVGRLGAAQFTAAKKDMVFINLGRGPVVDSDALITALNTGQIKGAALDVHSVEPLPASSPLWAMDNVLVSPHNMDHTVHFMQRATEFFVKDNLPRFMRGEPLLNQVDTKAGY